MSDTKKQTIESLAERTKLMSQLEQAKMQEQVAASVKQVNELSAPGNTPSLNEVRDKIEARYANALGQAELAPRGIMVNAAAPGYTATDLNAHRGGRTVQQAAEAIVRLATLEPGGPTGGYFDENGALPW